MRSQNQIGSLAWLRDLAVVDRRLVRALLHPDSGGQLNSLGQYIGPAPVAPGAETPGVPSGGVIRAGSLNLACGLSGWEVINVTGCFNSPDADKSVEIEACGNDLPCVDFWVFDIDFTIRRPDWLAGSALKATSDADLLKVTYVDVTEFIVHSYCDHVISSTATPLENFAKNFECHCPAGIILQAGCQGIEGTLTNRRPLAATEVPLEVTITLHGWRLGMPYSLSDYASASRILTTAGILPAAAA